MNVNIELFCNFPVGGFFKIAWFVLGNEYVFYFQGLFVFRLMIS